MEVDIQFFQLELDKAIAAHIRRKLTLALSRMEPHISAISVDLSDVVGDKGGVDTRCYLQISVVNLPDIEIEDTQTDLYRAIDRVIQKADRSLARKLFSAGITAGK